MKHQLCLYIVLGFLLIAAPFADSKEAVKPMPHSHEAMMAMKSNQTTVDLVEKIGGTIPLDIELIDENHARHKLKNLLDKPTILALVYYYCPMSCSVIQGNLANTINEVPLKLGQDYQVMSVSFDPEETPEDARQSKNNYIKIIKIPPDKTSWRFFTADPGDIKRITEAVGFQYIKVGPHQFTHPNLVTVLGSDGKIIRYLYGTQFLPFDIGMAVSEALQGKPGISIKKILSYCFEYDPQKNRYSFQLLRVFGFVTLILISGFLFFLLRKDKDKT